MPRGRIVAPGLIDMHVHLREPGFEEDETIATRHGRGRWPAASPRSPACPTPIRPSTARAPSSSSATRPPGPATATSSSSACVSQNREGKELAEIGQLVEAGAVAFSDDGAPVYDAELMRRAFEYCQMFDKPVLNHAEVRELTQQGVMHEGLVSLVLGLPGHSRRRRRRDDQPATSPWPRPPAAGCT